MRAFLNNRSGCQKKSETYRVLPRKSQFYVFEMDYLGNSVRYHKKISSVPQKSDRGKFLIKI